MVLRVDIRHRFSAFALGIRFEAQKGVTALFGRSGAGKTTIINAVAGLFEPQDGAIWLGDTCLFDRREQLNVPPHKRQIGYVFQDARLFPHMTVSANLDYGAKRNRAVSTVERSRVVEMLDLGGLLLRKPAGLSGGERQRVALGRALLCDPSMLLLDEPLAALDMERKRAILPYFERLRDDAKIPILYVSHAVSEVARLANQIVMIDKGRVLGQGAVDDVLSDPEIWPVFGVRDAGAVLRGRVLQHHSDGLTAVDVAGQQLMLPKINRDPGSLVTLRVNAHDVIVGVGAVPENLSALNSLVATVRNIRDGEGPGVIVTLDMSGTRILARITRRSCLKLGLSPGMACFAILKSVAAAPFDIG